MKLNSVVTFSLMFCWHFQFLTCAVCGKASRKKAFAVQGSFSPNLSSVTSYIHLLVSLVLFLLPNHFLPHCLCVGLASPSMLPFSRLVQTVCSSSVGMAIPSVLPPLWPSCTLWCLWTVPMSNYFQSLISAVGKPHMAEHFHSANILGTVNGWIFYEHQNKSLLSFQWHHANVSATE